MRFQTAASFALAVLIGVGGTAQIARAQAANTMASPAAGTVDPAAQKALTDLYALGCAAAFDPTDSNIDAAFAMLSTDYVNVDLKGKQMTRDEVVGQGKQQLKMLKATACTNTFDSISQTDPNTIVVVNTLRVTGQVQAPDGQHQFDLTNKGQDTWKNSGGKWMQTQSKDLRILVKVDGNVVQDQGS